MTNNRTLEALDSTTFMPAGSRISLVSSKATNEQSPKTYLIDEWRGVRAYVFSKPPAKAKRQRIQSMVDLPVSKLDLKHFSWPFDVIVDKNKKLVGYLASTMHSSVTLSQIITSKDGLSYNQRICIAKNLCVALDAYHRNNLVFGCLTPRAIYVDMRTCRVFLDPGMNAQFESLSGAFFPCLVGSSAYMAPDLHTLLLTGGSLLMSTPRRISEQGAGQQNSRASLMQIYSQSTDLFSLGVIIFGLLNNYEHPLSVIEEGKPGIPKLDEASDEPSRHPKPNPLMAGIRKPFSLRKGNHYFPNYRHFRVTPFARKGIYYRCFNTNRYYHLAKMPPIDEWHDMLERLNGGPRARICRFRIRLSQKLRALLPREGTLATDAQTRQAISTQYPNDIAGSESTTSPRVFWRTTILFAMGVFLCSLAGGFDFVASICRTVGISTLRTSPFALGIGAFGGTLIVNWFASKNRKPIGYELVHYCASFICCAIACLTCGLLFGGVN